MLPKVKMQRRILLLSLGLLCSCSLLVQFRDELDPCKDGGCDAATDASFDATDGFADAGSDAKDGNTADVVHICKGAYDGWYCGYNAGLAGRSYSPDDLVHCFDGGAYITPCAAGCVAFPSGTPDMCNSCGNRQGYYCGGQLAGSQPEAKDWWIYCSGGTMTPQKKCPNNCVAGPGDAACL